MRFIWAVFSLCFLAALSAVYAEVLHVASFNIRILGEDKMSKPDVVDILDMILNRYDLVMVQELRAAEPDAINELLASVQSFSGLPYEMVVGPREGRSSSKEQYVFFYRSDKLKVTDEYRYVEPNDEFERQPYIVRFETLVQSSLPSDFAVVNIHTKPDYKITRYEISALTQVYEDVVARWGLEDVIITGDYNADCTYVKSSYWSTITLFTDPRFHWLLDNDVDTTVSTTTDCAYDRFVLAGSNFEANLPPARVFLFDSEYGLTPEFTLDVSDHYPIEMTFA